MTPVALILASVVLGVVGQVLLKAGLNRIGPLSLGAHGAAMIAWRIGTNPRIWAGLGLYAVGLLFWLAALSQVELGYAYPFISLSYVLILVASWAVFHERVTLLRALGVAAICFGVYVIARG